jgi:hypothetical protein
MDVGRTAQSRLGADEEVLAGATHAGSEKVRRACGGAGASGSEGAAAQARISCRPQGGVGTDEDLLGDQAEGEGPRRVGGCQPRSEDGLRARAGSRPACSVREQELDCRQVGRRLEDRGLGARAARRVRWQPHVLVAADISSGDDAVVPAGMCGELEGAVGPRVQPPLVSPDRRVLQRQEQDRDIRQGDRKDWSKG